MLLNAWSSDEVVVFWAHVGGYVIGERRAPMAASPRAGKTGSSQHQWRWPSGPSLVVPDDQTNGRLA
jgi:hypothetical protein